MAESTLVIEGGRAPLSGALSPVQIIVTGTTVVAVERGQAIPQSIGLATLDASGCTVLPGLIDVHVHGAMGADTMDADPAAIARMARFATSAPLAQPFKRSFVSFGV